MGQQKISRYRCEGICANTERNLKAVKPAFFVTPSKSLVHYRQYIHFSNGTT